jgi:hypothetical protein
MLHQSAIFLAQGLIMLEAKANRVVILTNRVSASSPLYPDSPLVYTNDLDIAADGTIYFTDSVDVHPHRNAQHDGNVSHIVSILGKPGFYDTVKGWGYGFMQVSVVSCKLLQALPRWHSAVVARAARCMCYICILASTELQQLGCIRSVGLSPGGHRCCPYSSC